MPTTFLLVVVLDDLERLPDLLKAWHEIGVGATLIRSQGGYRIASWLERIGLGGLHRLLEQEETVHKQQLLFSLVQDESLLKKAIGEAERAVGGFERANSGLLFALPVGPVLGASKWKMQERKKKEVDERWLKPDQGVFAQFDPEAPVSEIVKRFPLTPCQVHLAQPIEEVVRVLLANPAVKVVAVVNDENHLVGLIEATQLTEALFFSIFPEVYLPDFRDVDEMFAFMKQAHHFQKAADIMQEPAYLHPEDTLKKAFKVMHKRKLRGIPLVDDQNHVVGYVNLLELLAICFDREDGGTISGGHAHV